MDAAIEAKHQVQEPPPLKSALEHVTELDIQGMTCASCVRRVERKLTKVAGVEDAQVNLATERATVRYNPAEVQVDALLDAVKSAGYTAQPRIVEEPFPAVAPAESAGTQVSLDIADAHDLQRQREVGELRRKSLVSLAVGAVTMGLMYLPLGFDMTLVAPVLLIAATVIQFWAGRVFYEAAWSAAKH